MAIGVLPPGEKPRVNEHEGEIAVWSGNPDKGEEVCGVLFAPLAGIDTGLECLRIACKMLDQPLRPLAGMVSFEESTTPNEDVAARLMVEVEGVPIEICMTPTQVCELAASTADTARRVG
jgi:hypothetical protein